MLFLAGGLYLSLFVSSNHFMNELIINLHMHTTYSDGSGTHAEIIEAALQVGLDAIITTDHNVLVNGPAGYYQDGDRKVMLLVGEEIHDQTADPQKNHLLVIGVGREMAELAGDTQDLIDKVQKSGGLAFIAHPVDPAAPVFKEPDISWEKWEVENYHGIELWNAMSEFKSLMKDWFRAIFYGFNPKLVAHGPFSETLSLWDQLLGQGKPVIAVGGSDAHAFHFSLGPIRKTIFPYKFHFQAVNTHIFTEQPLSGDFDKDRHFILEALRSGHAFVGYDLPAQTYGFKFTAQGKETSALMGDEIKLNEGVTLQINLPQRAECHLLKDGEIVKTWQKREICTFIANEAGVYRVEVYLRYLGVRRGWIFSNPIYLRE
jgi:hypothetical protein